MLVRSTVTLTLVLVDFAAYAAATINPQLALPRSVYVGTLVAALIVGSFRISVGLAVNGIKSQFSWRGQMQQSP